MAIWVLISIACPPLNAADTENPSAEQSISETETDSARVEALNDLFKEHLRSDPERAREYAEEALSIAQEANYANGIYKITNNLGILFSNQGDYETALSYHHRNLKFTRESGDIGRTANCLVNIGGVKFMQGDYDAALEDFKEAYPHYLAAQDTGKAMHVLNNVGLIYQDQGRLGDALNQFMTVLEFRQKQQDSTLIAPALLNVGLVYQQREQLEKAERFFTEALELSQAIDDKFRSVAAMNSLASTWSDQGRHQDAAKLHAEAEKIAMQVSDQFGLAEACVGRAREFSYLNQPDSAAYMAQEALRICRAIGRKSGEAQALLIMGEGRLRSGNPGAAIANLKMGIAIADTIGHNSLKRDGYRTLSEAYSALGIFREAYQMQDSFIQLNSEINSERNDNVIAELQAQYEAGQQEEAISALQLKTAEDELNIARSRRRNIILIAGSSILLVLALALFMRFRQKKRLAALVEDQRTQSEQQRRKVEAQNKQIREINSNLERMIEARTHAVISAKEELDVFLYQSAHALRRPLVRVEGLVSLIQQKLTEPEDLVLLEKLGLTLSGMDSLLHKLVTTNEVQRREPELAPIDVPALIEEVAEAFDWTGNELKIDIPAGIEIVADEFLLRTIFTYTLENALQYRSEDPSKPQAITVSVGEDEALTIFHIKDNGRGIPQGEEEKIFDMFYRADHQTRGSGLGLYVVRKAAEKLHGTATAAQLPEGGAHIRIEFPRHFM